jgi:hypothetical protein
VPFANDESHRETAKRIEHDHPHWIVMWGVYSREYVAFPLFRVPSGTVLSSGNFNLLAAKMRQIELTFWQSKKPEGGADADSLR